MDFLLFLATFVLFFVLTPGVVLSLPPKGSKLVTALVHALLFAILLTLFMECFKTDDKEGMMRVWEVEKPKARVKDSREGGFWTDKRSTRIKGTSVSGDLPDHDFTNKKPTQSVSDEISGGDNIDGWGSTYVPYVDMATRKKKVGHYNNMME
jgi:hypothetical protein